MDGIRYCKICRRTTNRGSCVDSIAGIVVIELGRRTVVDVLKTGCTDHPDRWAVVDGTGRLTYKELWDRSLRVAAGLRNLGVGPRDRVVLVLDNSIDHAVTWFGCNCLQAMEVPINTEFMPPQLAYVVDHCEAAVAVVDEQYVERFRPVLAQMPNLRTLVVRGDVGVAADLDLNVIDFEALTLSDPIVPECAAPSDPLGIIYTSGTTAVPKGVVVSQAQTYGRMWPLGPGTAGQGDTTLVVLPIYHVIGQCRGLYNTLIAGGTAVLEPRFSASGFWDTCRRHEITYVPLVGAMARYLLSQPERPDDNDNPVRHVALGTTIPEVEEFRRRFAVEQVSVSYGLTEVGGVLVGEAGPDGCGRLRPDFEARLVDEADVAVPDGSVGELVLRPSEPWTVMLGYYKMPQETLDQWRNLWLHTGDLMVLRADGTYAFVERRAERIRVHGENVSPGEVEAQLAAHPAARECAVVGVPAPNTVGDQEILAAVVLRDADAVAPEDLLDFLAERLPRFALPRYIAFVSELPRTEATHRVQRARIAATALATAWDRLATANGDGTEEASFPRADLRSGGQ